MPFIEQDDLQGVFMWLIPSSLWPSLSCFPSQDDKNEALCIACSAHSRDDRNVKCLMIELLLKEGASRRSLKGGRTPLEIVEYHRVWYEQRGIYQELVYLLK